MNEHKPESGYARTIKEALTLRNVAIGILVGIVGFFVLVCFGVIPL